MMAVAGNAGIDLFGEWNGNELRPLAMVAQGQFISLNANSASTQAA